MNYIWDVLLRAKAQNINVEAIKFKYPQSYSPYMEIAFEDLNTSTINDELTVEINPYYRFYHIFKDLFNINLEESLECREALFDILIHYLGILDLKQGLTKQKYYEKYILKDINKHLFSKHIKKLMGAFDNSEQSFILSALVSLYTTGNSLDLFRRVVKRIFNKSIVYINQDHGKEILIYLGEAKKTILENKIEILISLFLHIEFKVFLYWQYHFGVLGMDDTMKIENMVLY